MSNWVTHDGRPPRPVEPSTKVDIKLRSGQVLEGCTAGRLSWYHDGSPADIVEYHVWDVEPSVDDVLPHNGNHDANGVGKMTNPKDAIGSTKLDLGLVPDSLVVAAAMAYTEGAIKYGRFNWRVAGVRASIYHAALRRHLARWWNGEDCDPVTGVPHLASVIACAGIVIDAGGLNKLNDDRPPRASLGSDIEHAESVGKSLRELFKAHNPKQFTIEDSSNG